MTCYDLYFKGPFCPLCGKQTVGGLEETGRSVKRLYINSKSGDGLGKGRSSHTGESGWTHLFLRS